MPSAFDLYNFYLQPEDLRDRTVAITVAHASAEDVFNPRVKRNEKRLVLSFVGKKKRLPLNKTQAAAMIVAAGTDDYARWTGVPVLLTPTTASNGKPTITITPAPASAGDGEISEPAGEEEYDNGTK